VPQSISMLCAIRVIGPTNHGRPSTRSFQSQEHDLAAGAEDADLEDLGHAGRLRLGQVCFRQCITFWGPHSRASVASRYRVRLMAFRIFHT
jgi:hypothetical protein